MISVRYVIELKRNQSVETPTKSINCFTSVRSGLIVKSYKTSMMAKKALDKKSFTKDYDIQEISCFYDDISNVWKVA